MNVNNSVTEWANQIPESFFVNNEPFDAEWSIICLEDVNMLPAIQGIYLILNEEHCLYVGKTTNLNTRFKNGHHRMVDLLKYSELCLLYLELPSLSRLELSNLEKYYICQNEPLLNV